MKNKCKHRDRSLILLPVAIVLVGLCILFSCSCASAPAAATDKITVIEQPFYGTIKAFHFQQPEYIAYPCTQVDDVVNPKHEHYWVIYLQPIRVKSMMQLKAFVNAVYHDYCVRNKLGMPYDQYKVVFRYDILDVKKYGLTPRQTWGFYSGPDPEFYSEEYPYTLEFSHGANRLMPEFNKCYAVKTSAESDEFYALMFTPKTSHQYAIESDIFCRYLLFTNSDAVLKNDSIFDPEFERHIVTRGIIPMSGFEDGGAGVSNIDGGARNP